MRDSRSKWVHFWGETQNVKMFQALNRTRSPELRFFNKTAHNNSLFVMEVWSKRLITITMMPTFSVYHIHTILVLCFSIRNTIRIL